MKWNVKEKKIQKRRTRNLLVRQRSALISKSIKVWKRRMGNKLSGPKRLLRWSPRRVSCKSWKGHRSRNIKKPNDFQWMCQMMPFQFKTLISNISKGNCCCIWNSVVVDKKGPDLCPAKYHLPWTGIKPSRLFWSNSVSFFFSFLGEVFLAAWRKYP